MSDPSRDPVESGDTDGGRSHTGTPRWVWVAGGIAVAVILALVLLSVFGGGTHGPGMH